jgi:hypothetical protein
MPRELHSLMVEGNPEFDPVENVYNSLLVALLVRAGFMRE